METGKITEQDYINQYTPCKVPGCDYLLMLDACLEVEFITCKRCGSYGAVTKDDFKKVDTNV